MVCSISSPASASGNTNEMISRELMESLRRESHPDDLRDVVAGLIAQIDAHEDEWRVRQERLRRIRARMEANLARRRAKLSKLKRKLI
jgi:hypothetical protein